jgi:ABC-2 type transport system permease protein
MDALFARPEIGFAVFAFWLVVPLAIGYYRFENADI